MLIFMVESKLSDASVYMYIYIKGEIGISMQSRNYWNYKRAIWNVGSYHDVGNH